MRFAAAILALALAGCVSVPLAAKSSTGEKFLGSATATPFSGNFELSSLDGKRCWGKYNQWDYSNSLRVNFKISDGRTGTAIIVRDATLQSGIGSGKDSKGATFDFLMGDSVSQAQLAW